MLPWLFGVLLVLNLGLFYVGYQRERAADPEPPPLPEGRYEIQLLSEVDNPASELPGVDQTEQDARTGVRDNPAPGAEPLVRESGRDALSVAVPPSEAAETRAANAQSPLLDSDRGEAVAEPPGVEEIGPAVENAGGEGALSPDELDAEPTEGGLEGTGEPSDVAPAAERPPEPHQ